MRLMNGVALGVALLGAVGSYAEEGVGLNDLEKQVTALSQEVAKLKQAGTPPVQEGHAKDGITFGGYGELVYHDFAAKTDAGEASGEKNTLDLLRFVLNVGYRFSGKFALNSELEVEHANEEKRGEVAVEMATLDYLWAEPLNVRAGLLLVPMGLINESHEPPVFHGVNRPDVEQKIIPTTWRENGVGIFGHAGPVSYRTYVMNGFQAVNDYAVTGTSGAVDGFDAADGVKEGGAEGSEAFAEDWAWVGRVDYSGVPGLLVGGSLYTGDAGQGAMVAGEKLKARTTLWETHGDYQWQGVELRGLYSRVYVGDVGLINQAQGYSGNESVGEQMWGGYGQVAYNVLGHRARGLYLAPFYRYERYNTQAKVPDGYASDPANDRTEMVYGITFKPLPEVVLKADFQNNNNRAGSGVDQWNLGVGYMF